MIQTFVKNPIKYFSNTSFTCKIMFFTFDISKQAKFINLNYFVIFISIRFNSIELFIVYLHFVDGVDGTKRCNASPRNPSL